MPVEDAVIEVRKLTFAYPDEPDRAVLRDVDLRVMRGECLTVLGESGSGKSTLLRLMCGLLKPVSGQVLYMGEVLDGPADDISMMFQNYGLFPWKNVQENIVLPLRLRGEKPDRSVVKKLLERLGLCSISKRYPGELSGGQRQRVALGRAAIAQSKLILMDEPFSALDIRNRENLQNFMKGFFSETGMTSVIVTHSIEEALAMGDSVAVFDPEKGRINEFFTGFRHRRSGKTESDDVEYYDTAGRIRELLMNGEMHDFRGGPGA